MHIIGTISAALLILSVAACGDMRGRDASIPPTGLKDTGSAGTSGGAASAPAGTGVVSTTRH